MNWYPQDPDKLNGFLKDNIKVEKELDVNGIIVPHAGYSFSGKIAGKTYSLVSKSKLNQVVILAPSHYAPLNGVVTTSDKELVTPLGKIKTFNRKFKKTDISQEHAINVQIPFIQYLNKNAKILPLVVGNINKEEAEKIADKLMELDAFFIVSSDLSHFNEYNKAVSIDQETIKVIEDMDLDIFDEIDACGKFPLLILFYLCKKKGWKPKLVLYKNSGDVTGIKTSVVGYAGFWF